jgi:hypothetical protein
MPRFILALAIILFYFQSMGEAVGQHHSCYCDDCVQKGKIAAPEAAPRPESGAYVAPPRTGTTVGESNSIGIEGLSIKFPELNLQLPELKLPHFTHRRRGPHMEVEAAKAPYVLEVERAEYSVQAESARPEADLRPEVGVKAPEFGHPLQRPDQKSSHYQQPHEANESSQVVLEQIRRFEDRERALAAQLEQMQQLLQHFSSLPTMDGTEITFERRIENSQDTSHRRQPQPLPAISMTRPASFEAPVTSVDRVPPTDTTSATEQTRLLETQVAELRRLVFALRVQRLDVQEQSGGHNTSNDLNMSGEAALSAESHAIANPVRMGQFRRLPVVLR